jgi:branched-chain amino acid transport system substrate-binding protein
MRKLPGSRLGLGSQRPRGASASGTTRRTVLKYGAAAAAVSAIGAPAIIRAQETVKVGVVYPISGDFARFGDSVAEATIMGFDHINEAGGIEALGGAKIEPVVVDIRSDPTVTRTETERVINDHDIVAVTGCYVSGLSMVASEVCERNGVPFVTGSIADGLSGRGFQYFFQVSPKASMFGRAQVEIARTLGDEFGPEKNRVAILFEDTDYGTSTAEGLRNTAEEMDFEIVLFESYPFDIPDAGPLVTRVARSEAEIVFPVSYLQDAILIIETLAARGVDVSIFGGGAGYLVPEFQDGLGPLSNLTFSVGSWNWDVEHAAPHGISEAYAERTGEPFIHEHAGEGYCMAQLIADAVERAGAADRDAVRDALRATELDPPHPAAIMPGGRLSFDETGWNHNVHPVVIQWQDGKPRTVFPPEDAATDPVWPLPPWDERA